MSGSGSSGNTSTVVQQSQPPAAFMQAYQSLLGQAGGVASQPLQQYSGNIVAGLSPDQQSGIAQIQNSTGVATPYINSAASEYGQATSPLWNASLPQYSGTSNLAPNAIGTIGQAQTGIGTGITQAGQAGQQATTAGQQATSAAQMGQGSNYAGNMSQYLSPYTNDVVNATQAEFNNQNAQTAQGITSNAIGAGAFGGDRESVAQGITAGQEQLAQAPVIANLENTGYTNAQNELNTQQGLAQSAANTNLNAANTNLNAAGTGISGYNSLANTANPELSLFENQQSTQLGANEANSWLASQAASGLAGLGNEAQSTSLAGANASLTAGSLEQQLQQEQLDVPYEQFEQQQAYPYQATNWLAGIAEGAGAGSGGTSSTTSPGASTVSQLLGGGLSLAGIGNLTGAFGSSGYLSGLFGSSGAASGAGSLGADFAGDAGALSLFKRGGGIKRASGGSAPDISVSYVPSSPQQRSGGIGIPHAPQPAQQQQMPSTSQMMGAVKDIEGSSGAPAYAPGGIVIPFPKAGMGRGIYHRATGGSSGSTGGTGGAATASSNSMSPNQSAALITQDYNQYLGRAPEGGAIQYYQNLLNNGLSTQGLTSDFINSPEHQAQSVNESGKQFNAPTMASNGVFLPQLKTGNGSVPAANLPSNLTSDYGSSGLNLPHTTYTPPMAPWNSALSTPLKRGGVPRRYATDGSVADDGPSDPSSDIDYVVPGPQSVNAFPVDAAPAGTTINNTGKGIAYSPPDNDDSASSYRGIVSNYTPPTVSNRGQKTIDSAPGMGLLAAGLGILAGKSPNTLQNVGAGGLEGLKQYQATKSQGEQQQQQDEDQANAGAYKKVSLDMEAQHFADTIQQARDQMKQTGEYQTGEQALRKADQEAQAKRDAQTAAYQNKSLALQQQSITNNAPDKWDQIIPMMGDDGKPKTDVNGLPLATYLDNDSGETKVMPYDPTRGGKIATGSNGLSDDAKKMLAQRALAGDPSALQGLGYNGQNKAQVLNLAAQIANQQGMTAQDMVANTVDLGGQKAGARTLGTRTATLELANNEFQQMAPLALQASANVDRGQYPNLNAIENAISKGTGDENIVRANAATNSLVNIYARAINPSGVPTDSDKAHAREILNTGFSQGQYSAAVDQLNKEIQAARQAPGVVRANMRADITGQASQAAQPAATISRPAGVPQNAQFSPSNKTWWWQEGGQWRSIPQQ